MGLIWMSNLFYSKWGLYFGIGVHNERISGIYPSSFTNIRFWNVRTKLIYFKWNFEATMFPNALK